MIHVYHVLNTISHEIPEYGKTGLVMISTNKIDKMKLLLFKHYNHLFKPLLYILFLIDD